MKTVPKNEDSGNLQIQLGRCAWMAVSSQDSDPGVVRNVEICNLVSYGSAFRGNLKLHQRAPCQGVEPRRVSFVCG